MNISEIMEKMIDFLSGNVRDIEHMMKVWTYSKTIGELEGLDEERQFILETAAIIHDIACPLCREKYNSIDGVDWQILVEADYIVNAVESAYSRENIVNFMEKVMKTETGKRLAKKVFAL